MKTIKEKEKIEQKNLGIKEWTKEDNDEIEQGTSVIPTTDCKNPWDEKS